MIHFVYPNASQRKKAFLGCGRYCPAEQKPADHYKPAHQDKTAEFEKLLPLIPKIAPDTRQQPKVHLYETQDQSREIYGGESKQLAYLLASIARVRSLKLAATHDIWCTGSIGVIEGDYPVVASLEDETFGIKLQAFLAEENSDLLFIVPADNITPEARQFCETRGAQVYNLNAFEQTEYYQQPLSRKTIVTVQPDKEELFRLISLVFQPGENPYKGLNAFQEEDADRFFGRETVIEQLYAKCKTLLETPSATRLLAILGHSGSGKSSLLRAGLLPKLKRELRWNGQEPLCVLFKPGNSPLKSLSEAVAKAIAAASADNLPKAERDAKISRRAEALFKQFTTQQGKVTLRYQNRPLILLIDQFEELYSPDVDAQERERLLSLLFDSAAKPNVPTLVIFTLRDDVRKDIQRRIDDVITKDGHHQLVSNMTADELYRAILEPAKRAGNRLTENVVYELVKQTEQHSGALPLLEAALDYIWEQKTPPEKTLAKLNELGGLSAALTLQANEIDRLLAGDEERELIRRVFLQLIQPDKTGQYVRKRSVLYSRIPAFAQYPAQVRTIFDRFSGKTARFLTVSSEDDEPTVELVHDSLIASWKELREWAAADQEFQQWRQRLEIALHEWKKCANDDNALLRGARLSEAENWLNARTDDLPEAERQFIESGIASKNREIAAVEAHRQRELATERQHAKRLRARLMLAIMLLIVAVGASILAVVQKRNADKSTKIAQQERDNTRLQAMSLTSENLFASGNAFDALLESLRSGKLLKHAQQQQISVTPDIRNRVIFALHQAVSGVTEFNRIKAHDGSINSVSFSPDGRFVTASDDNTVKLWDADGRFINTLESLDRFKSVKFSPDGQFIVGIGDIAVIKIWDNNGNQLNTLRFGSSTSLDEIEDRLRRIPCRDFDFSPEGEIIVVPVNTVFEIKKSGRLEFWNIKEGRLVNNIVAYTMSINDMRFSPDGNTIVTIGIDVIDEKPTTIVKLWKCDGTFLRAFSIHSAYEDKMSVAFGYNGQSIITRTSNSINFWNLDGTSIKTLFEANSILNKIGLMSYCSSGEIIAMVELSNKNIQIYNSKGEHINTLQGHSASISSMNFSYDGKVFASASEDGIIKLWKVNHWEQPQIIKKHTEPVRNVRFTPDGKRFASIDTRQTVVFWDRNGVALNAFTVPTEEISDHPLFLVSLPSLNFISDQPTLVTLSKDNIIRLFQFDGRFIKKFENPLNFEMLGMHNKEEIKLINTVLSVSASPDGKSIVSCGAYQGVVNLWDYQGSVIKSLIAPRCTQVAFSPDSQLIAIVSHELKPDIGKSLGNMMQLKNYEWIISLWNINDVLTSNLGLNDQYNRVSNTSIPLKILRNHDGPINGLKFTSDGKFIASVSLDRTVKIWKGDGTLFRTFSGYEGRIQDINFNHAGTQIVTAGEDGLLVWDIISGKRVIQFGGTRKITEETTGIGIRCMMDWKNGGGILVVKVFENSPAMKVGIQKNDHIAFINGQSTEDLPEDKAIDLLRGDEGTQVILRIIRQQNNSFQREITREKYIHSSLVPIIYETAIFNYNDQEIISGGELIQVWNLKGRGLKKFQRNTYIERIRLSPDGQYIASINSDQTITLWDYRTGKKLKISPKFKDRILSISFTSDGKNIVLGGEKGVFIWDINKQKLTRFEEEYARFIDSQIMQHLRSMTFAYPPATFYGIHVSPDKRFIASADSYGTAKFWNIDGTFIKSIPEKSYSELGAAKESKQERLFFDMDFSPNGNLVAVTDIDNTVKIYKIEADDTPVATLQGHLAPINSVKFSPDGKFILTGSNDRTIKLWNVDGTEQATFRGHSDSIYTAIFSPNGQMIASASRDGIVKIWSLDGKELKTLKGNDAILDISFSPDGSRLAAGCKDGSVLLWDFDLDSLIVQGCNWIQGYLKNNSTINNNERELCDKFLIENRN